MIKKIKLNLSKDTHFSELFKGSSIAFFFKAFGMIIGYVFTLLLAKWYGANILGLYTLSFTILNMVIVISIFGFDNSIVKFIAEYRSKNQINLINELYLKSISFSFTLAFIFTVIMYYFSSYISLEIFRNPNLEIFIQIAALSIVPFTILKINAAVFRAHKNMLFFSLFQNVIIMFFAIIILTILQFSFSKETYNSIISYIGGIICSFLLSIFFIKKKYSLKYFSLKYSTISLKKILKVSFPMFLTSSMVLVVGWSDTLMLGYFGSTVEVGIYSIVYKLSLLTIFIQGSIASIAMPKFIELYTNEKQLELSRLITKTANLTFIASLPIVILLVFGGKIILNFYGKDFIDGYNALIILLIGYIINLMFGPLAVLMNGLNQEKKLFYFLLVSALVNVILNLYLIPKYNYIGASISSSISIIIWSILSFLSLWKRGVKSNIRIGNNKNVKVNS